MEKRKPTVEETRNLVMKIIGYGTWLGVLCILAALAVRYWS